MNTRSPWNLRGRSAAPAVVWAVALVAACGSLGRGEDDRAVDDVPPPLRQMQQQGENRIDLGANFDANVFQQHGGGFSVSAGRRRPSRDGGGGESQPAESPTLAFVRKATADRLAEVEAVCGLSDDQRRKLRLALESDGRRFAEEIEAERRKYQGLQVNFNDQEGQRKWQQFQQDVQRCRERLQQLFDGDSLFAKVLPTTLDAEQAGRLAAETDARRSHRWKAMVRLSMLKCDDVLGLDERQHEAIEKLLLDRQPRLRDERRDDGRNHNTRETQQTLVWLVLSEIDPQRLQAVLSDRQWQVVVKWANQGKSMRSFIEAQGILEKVAP